MNDTKMFRAAKICGTRMIFQRSFMKTWKILSPKVLTEEERPDNITADTQAKVKVTQVLFTGTELSAYLGHPKPKYPVVPGRYAVGVVGETGAGCSVEKNERVYFRDFTPCGSCPACLRGDSDDCAEPKTAGVNMDGYMRDFVVSEESNLSPLPPSVSDDEALFIGIVSLGEAVIDRLNVSKGMHVAVLGAGEIGNILSQLLIYHQAVPILIDSDEERLAVAARCGVYYTVKADETMEENIARITGGRMAAGSVYSSFCGLAPDLPFGITAAGGIVVYTGYSFPEISAQLKAALDKHLTITSVANDRTGDAAAINLLVNRAVNLAPFQLQKRPAAQLADIFKEEAAKAEAGKRMQCCIVNML